MYKNRNALKIFNEALILRAPSKFAKGSQAALTKSQIR